MRSFRTLDRRAGFGLSAFALLLAMVAPGLVPAFASADSLTTRSIALSTSAAGAENVTYDIAFTPSANAGAFVIQFCSDSPLLSANTCVAPVGFTAENATSSNGTVETGATATKVVVTEAMTANVAANVTLANINNPTSANDSDTGFYARIATYADATAAGSYATGTPGAGAVDTGGVALSITDSIGVTAAVRESLTFCVSGDTITANCAATTAPSMTLGSEIEGLSNTVASNTDSIYTQLSTNAAGGAVVNLKSSALGCGGLVRAGAPASCDIGPSVTGDLLGDNKAMFGLKVGTAFGTASGATPSGSLVANAYYNTTDYKINFVDNTEGVTSPYGSELLNSADAPVNNMNMQLTFAAAVANDTPAGTYSADLSMIATGKY